jgi:hypothetical protein
VYQADQYRSKPSGKIASGARALQDAIAHRLGPTALLGLRIFSISFAAIFAIGFLSIIWISPKYSATALLAPQISPESSSAMSGLGTGLGNLGGLSSLLGTKNQPNNLVAFQTLLGTAEYSEYLMQHDHFDKLAFPNGLHHSALSVAFHTLFGQPTSDVVTPADVQAYIQSNILLQPDDMWGYLRLSYANKKRDDAIKILKTVIYSGDIVLRQREAASLDVQIHYLSRVTQTTTDVEQQSLFRKLLGEKLASKVLIDTQGTYAFKIFDAPSAPTVPNSPNAAMLVLLVIVFALALATTFTVGWWWYRNRTPKAS